MRSASSLYHRCSYPAVLAREIPKKARQLGAAAKGHAFHEAIHRWATTGTLPDGDTEIRAWVEGVASWWKPPPGAMFEVAMGLDYGGSWVDVEEPEPHVYVPKQPGARLLTAGRADVLWLDESDGQRIAVVRDWKTGRYPSPPVRENLQLTALAFAAASMFGAVGFVRELVYVRDGRVEGDVSVELDSDDGADAWAMLERAAKMDEKPRPGPHCAECWESRLRRCSFAAK